MVQRALLAEVQYLLRYGERATTSASVSPPDRAGYGHSPYVLNRSFR